MSTRDTVTTLATLVVVLLTIAVPAAEAYYLGGLDAACWVAGVIIFWAAILYGAVARASRP